MSYIHGFPMWAQEADGSWYKHLCANREALKYQDHKEGETMPITGHHPPTCDLCGEHFYFIR